MRHCTLQESLSLLVLFLLMVPGFGQAETGVTDTEIVLGSSLALEGHASFLGTQTLHGAQAYLNSINEKGGIHGRKLRIISYNDNYDPDTCEINTKKLIDEDHVFALFSYVGTPTTVKVIPLIDAARIPLFGVFSGAESLRQPVNKNIFNVRSSYYQETAGIVEHFWKDLGLKNIAVFHQNDAYGQAGLKGVELALEKLGSKPVAIGTYERGSTDISSALETIRNAKPDAVVMIGVYAPTAMFVRSAKWSNFSPYFHSVSFVGAEELAKMLGVGRDSDGLIVTQVVPPPESETPAIVEYRTLLKKSFPEDEPNFVSLEGFFNAKALVSILEKTGKELTRQSFVETADSCSNLDIGLEPKVTFSSTDHQAFDAVYFTVIKDGKYVEISDWTTVKKKF